MEKHTSFDAQITRIQQKLKTARQCDPGFSVFGSSSHRYEIGTPIHRGKIIQFETRYGIKLPPDFVEFLTKFGHGARGRGDAAGPFYGIYPLGKDGCVIGNEASLTQEPIIHPNMTDEEWRQESRRLFIDDKDLSEQEEDAEFDRLYSGLLVIGTQGCSNYHALVINGQHAGRVVNLDLEAGLMRFAFEVNFLDWYERWLDEIISGILLVEQRGWFAYSMGGDDRHLMMVFDESDHEETKSQALNGLLKLVHVRPDTSLRLDQIYGESSPVIRNAALKALTKFDIVLARPHLKNLIHSSDAERLVACQSIYWNAKKNCAILSQSILDNLCHMEDAEAIRYALYVLEHSGIDYTDAILPFANHTNASIRHMTISHLGKNRKNRYIDVFLKALRDESPSVVHGTLQALHGVTDTCLLPAYQHVAKRFQSDEMYIRTNLGHNLKSFGFPSVKAFENRGATAKINALTTRIRAPLDWFRK